MTKLGLVITDGVGYRNFILSDFFDCGARNSNRYSIAEFGEFEKIEPARIDWTSDSSTLQSK
jgi:hypothetical protein